MAVSGKSVVSIDDESMNRVGRENSQMSLQSMYEMEMSMIEMEFNMNSSDEDDGSDDDSDSSSYSSYCSESTASQSSDDDEDIPAQEPTLNQGVEVNQEDVGTLLGAMRKYHGKDTDDLKKKNIKRKSHCSTAISSSISTPSVVLEEADPVSAPTKKKSISIDQSPVDMFSCILRSFGYTFSPPKAANLKHYFMGVTNDRIGGYSTDVITAVRKGNTQSVKQMYQNTGFNLLCCNRFGESMLHTACRYARVDFIEWMIQEGNISLRICDDFGRNPMHDGEFPIEPFVPLFLQFHTSHARFLFH